MLPGSSCGDGLAGAEYSLRVLSSGDSRLGRRSGPHSKKCKNPHAAADSLRKRGLGLSFRQNAENSSVIQLAFVLLACGVRLCFSAFLCGLFSF